MHVYRLSARQAEAFRAEGRVDPFTRSPFETGDEIVFCANEKIAYLAATWRLRDRCPNEECRCPSTTRFPQAAPELRFRRRRVRGQPRTSATTRPARRRGSFWRTTAGLGSLALIWFVFCSPPDPRAPSAPAPAVRVHVISPVVQNVNLRQSPGHLRKRRSDVIRSVPTGTALEVLEGPRAADGLRWWRVRCLGTEGWMAERTESGAAIIVAQ